MTVTTAEVIGADAGALSRDAQRATASGGAVSAIAERTSHAGPEFGWQGQAATAFGDRLRHRATAMRLVGHSVGTAGAAVSGYARVLTDAHGVAVEGERMRVAGEREMGRGRWLYAVAARAGNPVAAWRGIDLYRRATASRVAGVALGEHAASSVAVAASQTVAALRAARRFLPDADGIADTAPNSAPDEKGWTWSDLLSAPVTVPTGLVDGIFVQPLRGLSALAAAQLVAEWRMLTDPAGRERMARWAGLGPAGLALAMGGEDAARAAAGFGAAQAGQYAAAVDEGRLGAEAVGDAAAAFGVVAGLADEFTGAAQIRDGLATGDLFTAASGVGAVVDLVAGSHGTGMLGDAGRFADDGGEVGRALWDGGPDLDIQLPTAALDGDVASMPDGSPRTIRTGPGALDAESHFEELGPGDPRLDLIRGRGRDPEHLAQPWLVDGDADPYTGIVKIVGDVGHGSGFVIGVDAAANRTTIATARHVIFERGSGRGSPGDPRIIDAIQFAAPGSDRPVRFTVPREDPVATRSLILPDDYGAARSRRSASDIAVLQVATTPPVGTFVFPLADRAPRLTAGQRIETAGYPLEWTRFEAGDLPRGAARGMVSDGGHSVPPLDDGTSLWSDRSAPGVEYFSPYSSPGMSGGPIWSYRDGGEVDLVGVVSFTWPGTEPGRLATETPLDLQQPYEEIIDPRHGSPGWQGEPGWGGYGNSLGSPRFTPELWTWLRRQSRGGR